MCDRMGRDDKAECTSERRCLEDKTQPRRAPELFFERDRNHLLASLDKTTQDVRALNEVCANAVEHVTAASTLPVRLSEWLSRRDALERVGLKALEQVRVERDALSNGAMELEDQARDMAQRTLQRVCEAKQRLEKRLLEARGLQDLELAQLHKASDELKKQIWLESFSEACRRLPNAPTKSQRTQMPRSRRGSLVE